MKISMWILHDALSSCIVQHNLNNLSKKTCIQSVSVYEDEDAGSLSDRYIYIADASRDEPIHLPAENLFFALIGDNLTLDANSSVQYVILPSDYSIKRAFCDICKIFEKYQDWLDALQSELDGEADITHICELGYSLLQNPVAVYDKNYTLLACAGELDMSYLEDKRGPYTAISSKLVMKLKNEPEYIKTIGVEGAGYQVSRHVSRATLYVNFSNGDVFDGRVCVPEDNRPVREGDYQIAEILTHFIRLAVNRRNTYADSRRYVFRQLLKDIVNGDKVSDKRLEHYMEKWHWGNEDRYICIYTGLDETETFTSSGSYMINQIESTVSDCCSFIYKNGLISIIHLLDDENPEDALANVTAFFIDTQHYVGISDVYYGILKSNTAYLQASIAYSMGLQNKPSSWNFWFKDYAMRHFFMNGTSVFPPILYTEEDVRKLAAYKDAKVDYYTTLKVYLENNMNLLHTAEKLFIHRTTLFHRLKYIEKIISADLNDSEARFRLLLSFKLMEMDNDNQLEQIV